jgi:cytoskeletal protein RodZ
MRTELLVGLLAVTLVVNVILGVELYNVLNHPITLGSSSNATATQLNATTATLITKHTNATVTTTTVTTTATSTKTVTVTSTTQTTVTTTATQPSQQQSYNFTYQADLEVSKSGYYEVSAHFAYRNEIVVITFPSGTTITLTAQSPTSTIYLNKGDYTITVYVSLVSNHHVNQDQVWGSLHLKFKFLHDHDKKTND